MTWQALSARHYHKVRVSNLPRTVSLMGGAPGIQSFGYGHTAFVACVCPVPPPAAAATAAAAVAAAGVAGVAASERIVTGGGDGTVRLWRLDDGKLLSTLVLAEPFPEKETAAGAGGVTEEVEGVGRAGQIMPATSSSTVWTLVSLVQSGHMTWRALSVRP